VIQVGSTSDYSLGKFKNEFSNSFPGFTLEKMRPLPDPSEAYDSSRGQYHSTRLLVLLEKHLRTLPVDRLLGVTAFDLFVPGMNYVFGEARCPGCVAVISTKRLKPSPKDEGLFRERVLKESVHEIGHTLGLQHCPDPLCVMHFSQHIGDTDRKGSTFCRECHSDLERQKVG
jgi:archaemetzincin